MNGAEHVKQVVPIRCEGVAVVLLKKSLDQIPCTDAEAGWSCVA